MKRLWILVLSLALFTGCTYGSLSFWLPALPPVMAPPPAPIVIKTPTVSGGGYGPGPHGPGPHGLGPAGYGPVGYVQGGGCAPPCNGHFDEYGV